MDSWRTWSTRRRLVAIGMAIVVVSAAVLWLVGRSVGDSQDGPTPLQIVLREIRSDGTWSEDTALRAFSAVFGPLPGVTVPEGSAAEVEFGTIAVRMLERYFDEITPEQRRAALDSAGPLAKYLDASSATGGFGEVRTMGPPDPVLLAAADDYEAEISDIISSIEARVGRSFGLDYDVVVAPNQTGILHASAQPFAADGENISRCEITVFPKTQALSGKNLTAVLAHETWHCFEYSRLGTLAARASEPPWIMEGQAMWVGEALVGGSDGLEPAIRHWNEYLLDPGPGTGLFARSYDAIGYYSHLHDRGIDPWTVLDPMLDQVSNVAAFDASVGGDGIGVVTSWAPSWFRDGAPTGSFSLVNAPGIPAQDVRPTPLSFTIGNGVFQQVAALDPLSAGLADVTVESEILTVDVIGQAMLGDLVFGDEIPMLGNRRVFCMVEDCTCPDGSPGPADHLGSDLRVGVTGDALSGSDALLRGWSISDWCDDSEEPPPPPGSGPGPCESGCGSSNGDPHLTTIDGRSYDFQAAGEFVLLRSSDIEVQARQEPYRGSDTVTINTAVAVGAADTRVVASAGSSGMTLRVDGADLPINESSVAGPFTITTMDGGVQLASRDGTLVTLFGLGEWGLNLVVSPSSDLRIDGVGLLAPTGQGFFPAFPDGSDVDESDIRGSLYTDLAAAWSVTAETSLFDYQDGTAPETYRDPSIPIVGAPFDFFELPEPLRDAGLAACSSITDIALLQQCAFDVAVTDDAAFVASYEPLDRYLTSEGGMVAEPGTGAVLEPLLEEVALVNGSALGADGTLFLSVSFEDQREQLIAIDTRRQAIVRPADTGSSGQIEVVSGSIWMSTSEAEGCFVTRFDTNLESVGRTEVPCVLDIFPPQLTVLDGDPWVYVSEPALRRVDPDTGDLGLTVPLPFNGGFLRSTSEAVFYSDLERGNHRLLSGDDLFEPLGTDEVISFPGGEGLWAQGDGVVRYYTDKTAAVVSLATDGTLVGAVGETALVERNTGSGPELWAYPADGANPGLLADGPLVGTGSQQTALDFFDDHPPLVWSDGLVKYWVEHGLSDNGAVVFATAIELPAP